MTVDVQTENTSTFSRSADAYETDYWRTDEENAVALYFTNTRGSLLVVGCGAGRTIPHLCLKGFSITAIDISPEMIKRARKRMSAYNVELLVGDAAQLMFSDNSFDYVFFPFHGIDYVLHRESVFREVYRVLKPGGAFLFSSHNRFFPRALMKWVLGKRRGKYILLPEQDSFLWTYHTSYFEKRVLQRIFKSVKVVARTTLQRLSWSDANVKDKILKIIPFIDKSLYFIAIK